MVLVEHVLPVRHAAAGVQVDHERVLAGRHVVVLEPLMAVGHRVGGRGRAHDAQHVRRATRPAARRWASSGRARSRRAARRAQRRRGGDDGDEHPARMPEQPRSAALGHQQREQDHAPAPGPTAATAATAPPRPRTACRRCGLRRSASSSPSTSGGRRAVTWPCQSMTAVAPVLVARTWPRWNSSARMRENCRCWSWIMRLPNQARLVALASSGGRVGARPPPARSPRRTDPRSRSAAARAARRRRTTRCRRPLAWSPIGIFIMSMNQLEAGRHVLAERQQVALAVAVEGAVGHVVRRVEARPASWCSRARRRR